MLNRALQAILIILGLLLIGRFGVTGALLGPEWMPGTEAPTASLDSEYRFLSVIALAAGLISLWVSRAPAQNRLLAVLLLGGTFIGGLARVYSVQTMGLPERPAIVALIIELALPPIGLALLAKAGKGRG